MTDTEPPKPEETTATPEAAPAAAEEPAKDDETTTATITALKERLRFFFSNANLRKDKWMRRELETNGSLSLDALLRFNSIKVISTDKELMKKAALDEELKELIVYEDGGSIRRVVPFDFKTMGDGSALSLYVKNVPVNDQPPSADGDDDDNNNDNNNDKEEKDGENSKKFRPTYAVTRDEIKALFEPYGRVGIVNLRYGRREDSTSEKEDAKYVAPTHRGYQRGESYPLGAAIVEFDNMEGMEKACKDLLPSISSSSSEEKEGDGAAMADGEKEGEETKKEPKTVLELKGNKLRIEKMKPQRRYDDRKNNNNNKRKHDDSTNGNDDDNNNNDNKTEEEPLQYNEFKLDWKKGCVITLTGLSTEKCSREAIREAVSDILGVSKDVKTSGLYVDYTRGDGKGCLRLKEPPSNEGVMKELVDKLNEGTVTIEGEKVESAKILEGEEEEKYYQDFINFMNNRNKQRAEEKQQQAKRQKFGHGRGGWGGRGGGGKRR